MNMPDDDMTSAMGEILMDVYRRFTSDKYMWASVCHQAGIPKVITFRHFGVVSSPNKCIFHVIINDLDTALWWNLAEIEVADPNCVERILDVLLSIEQDFESNKQKAIERNSIEWSMQ